ncbi:MAG: rhodanese-like domain-containing protein [Humidesulfovibrio sp.]|nr:rhodanese-like domain-containing protein [Humidesulfovibrio sp.]
MNRTVPQIPVTEAKALLDAARPGQRTLLDVRQDFEYAEGHLPGAVLIPLPELADRARELDPALPAVVYCRSGARSLAGANLLSGLGFRDVVSMQGGILAWDGAQATGPVDLGLAALLPDKNAQEMLERAWGMELALGDYYSALAGRAAEAEVAALFERLAGFEEKHRRTLTEIWKRLDGGDAKAFEARARAHAWPDILEGGIGAVDYLGQLGDPSSTAESLELAMAVEAQAMDLYLRRAKDETDVDLRRTLLLLAEEEKAHLKVLGAFVDGRKRF